MQFTAGNFRLPLSIHHLLHYKKGVSLTAGFFFMCKKAQIS